MRFCLVGPDLEANLSLGYLSSVLLRAGHEVLCVGFNDSRDTDAVLRAADAADVIGLSLCYQVRAFEFVALAERLKQLRPTQPIIVGGHFATCAATELLDDVAAFDVVVLHEGELALVELAALGPELVARAGDVAGVVTRVDGVPTASRVRPSNARLDELPFPDRRGPVRLVAGVPTAYLMGSRGCVSQCDYCCIMTLHRRVPGPRFRQRSVSNIAAEMHGLHGRGVRQFVFHDDNFLVPSLEHNLVRVGELEHTLGARGMRDIGLVLKCSPAHAQRPVLEKLRALGLLRIFMGIESGSEEGLKSIGRQQSVAQAEAALSLCEDLAISSQYTMIIFHPDATLASMRADLSFVKRHPSHPLNYCRAEVYAQTPLEQRLLAEGRLSGDYRWRTYRYRDPKVDAVWSAWQEMFHGRAWGHADLLSAVIGFDHHVATYRHFYRGPAVDAVAAEFADWQVRLNLETAELFATLIDVVDRLGPEQTPALQREIKKLGREERRERRERASELCRFKKVLQETTLTAVGLQRPARKRARSRFPLPAAPHAAAVALAIQAASLPVAAADTLVELGGTKGPVRVDHGIREAAPPPDWRRDGGIAEAAPPPAWFGCPQVLIRTEKPYRVIVTKNGARLFEGKTPLRRRLDNGNYRLEFKDGQGAAAGVKQIVVRGGAVSPYDAPASGSAPACHNYYWDLQLSPQPRGVSLTPSVVPLDWPAEKLWWRIATTDAADKLAELEALLRQLEPTLGAKVLELPAPSLDATTVVGATVKVSAGDSAKPEQTVQLLGVPEESAPARAIRHLLETATWPRAGGGPYETTVVIAYRRALPVPVQPDIRHDDGIAEAAPPPDWPPRPNE